MTDFAYRLKEIAFFIPKHIGKLIGGLLGYFVFKSAIAFFILVFFGNEFDKVFGKVFNNKTAAIDHLSPRKRIIFLRVFFNVMGHIAKADGRVTKTEIAIVEGLMQEMKLKRSEVELAQRSFNDGKNPDFPLAETLENFYKKFRSHIALREWFLRLQIQVALAGDGMSSVVARLLNACAAQMDIPGSRFSDLVREAKIFNSFTPYARQRPRDDNYFRRQKRESRYSRYDYSHDGGFGQGQRSHYQRGQQQYRQRSYSREPVRDALAEAYILLGVSAADDAKHITRAYRRLLSQNHPDKLIGQGANKAEREVANAKTIEIRKAYELIKARRNF
ncbi:MAG: co-chaperone DjlA [Gammaproteobacteria bacterium]|nr:co-chaperone DjlA [Gammaproteobacteria bacterium]NNC97614.1 co-chaperone DjlA [Gammaproteobacteria bacterium]NNM14200.1 co-chaperone DjlA [Gammaproteobacteria bacterium]